MNKTICFDEDFINFRETPWDKRSLGLKAIEIMEIRYGNYECLNLLLKSMDDYCQENAVDLLYLRINAADKLAKKALSLAGFEFIEASLKITHTKVQKCEFGKIFPACFVLRQLLDVDVPQIKRIAHEAFDFSRFHEDYNISDTKARLRYADWVDDLVEQDKKFLIYEAGGLVKSFLAYDGVPGGAYSLLLAGSEKNQGYLSPFFWSSFLTSLQSEGARKIVTTVSAANVPIINLYLQLGFGVEQTLFGFHKFYNKHLG